MPSPPDPLNQNLLGWDPGSSILKFPRGVQCVAEERASDLVREAEKRLLQSDVARTGK